MNSICKTQMSRTGTTFVELVVAMALLSTLLALALPVSARIARVRQVYRQRLVAMEEVANQMDRLLHMPVDDVRANAGQIQLPDYIAAQLVDATLDLNVTDEEIGTRLRLEMSWTDRVGNASGSLGLTSWIFPQ